MKRGRPKNPIGAEREGPRGLQKWNGKRWVSSDYFDRTNPQERADEESPREPAPEPKPRAADPEPDLTGGEQILDNTSELDSELDSMADIFSQFEQSPPPDDMPDDPESEGSGAGFALKGEHLLLLLDIAGSFLTAFAVKKLKISEQPRKDFKLSQDEKEELKGLAQACAETINFSGSDNPWVNFSAGYLLLMSTKLKVKNG